MKKKLILSVVLGLCFSAAFAQNNLGKADDIGRIVLNPCVVSNATIPQYAEKALTNKLQQVAAKNGVGGNAIEPRFVITANLIELTKDITPTAPPMIALTLSPTIYIGDAVTGTLYSSCEIESVKGVGNTETKAYLNAIKNISVNHPAVVRCINEGKEKIIEYYNSQIDFLIAEAESLAQSQQFDEAMVKLAAVPDICKDAYMKAVGKIGEIYQQKIDLAGDVLYNEAYAQWNTAKTQESAEKVVELLAQINPLSAAAAKGRKLVKSVEAHYAAIAARRREIEERNWAFKMQQYNDSREDRNTERDQNHEYRMQGQEMNHEYRMQGQEMDHEYRMQKSSYDYEVQMEHAKSGAAVAEYALQEVKGVVAMMSSGNSGRTSASSSSVTTTIVEKANVMVDKLASWFN